MPTEDPKEPERKTIIPPGKQPRQKDKRRNPSPVIDAQAQEVGENRETREEHRRAAEEAAAAAGVGAEPESAGAASEAPKATVTVEEPMGPPPGDKPRDDHRPRRRAGIGAIAASALLGGLMIGAGLVFYASQLMPPPTDPELVMRLNALDSRLKETAARAGEIDETKGRIAAIEQSVASFGDTSKRLANIEERLATPGEDIAAEVGELRRRVEELSSGEGGALLEVAAQVQKLEGRVAAMEKKAPEVAAAASSARASSRSAALSNLRASVEAGRPYAAELNVASKGAPQSIDLAPLQQHAAEGVVSLEELARTLETSRAAMLASETTAAERESSSWMDKMWSSAKSVVRISRSDDKGADKVLDRMKPLVASGDLDGAIRLAETLPDAARAPLAPWLDRARARVAATAALTRLEQSPAPAVAPAREG